MTGSRALALVALLALLPAASAQEAIWEPSGGPRSGYSHALAAAADGTLFVVAAGDLYRSEDGGHRWTLLPTPLGEVVGSAVSTAGALFVWSAIFCTETCHQEGAYASTDGGETWRRVEVLGEAPLVYGVTAAADGRVFASTDLGLFLSDDGGASWRAFPLGAPVGLALAAHPAGYVAVSGYAAGSATLSFSSDNGETWTTHPIPSAFPALRDLRLDARGTVLAASTHQPAQALYRTTDGGASWKPISFPAPCAALTACRVDAVDLVEGAIWASFSSVNPRRSLGVFRTEDGRRWQLTGLDGPAASSFVGAGGAVLASTSRAVFRYAEDGWAPSSEGIERSWMETLVWGPDGALYTASFEGDVSRYDPATDTWTPLPYLRLPSALAPAPDGRLFAGSSGEPGAWVLEADAETWTPLGLRNVRTLHRTAAGTLLVGAWHTQSSLTLARSTDDGASWSAAASFNPLVFVEAEGTLYVGTGDGVHRSTDDGATWTPLGLEDVVVRGLSARDEALWAVTPTDKNGNSGGRVFRSVDGGATWALAWTTDARTEAVVAAEGAVFVAARGGLYRSTDDGATWAPYVAGLPDRSHANALALGPDGRLYAGLWLWSVYRTPEPVATASAPAPPASDFALRLPYPNPATQRAVVPFDVASPSRVRLSVFDVLGREVAVLVDASLDVGRHEAVFDGAGMAAGVYFVRATIVGADGRRRTAEQRVTLLR